ncbi:unnamed protein product (macronuclear) [Paramecium tetraurelia]|uniref:Ribosome production factor 2 homolog n=1 Tax=Paramecium tetraurelia TaxID=5888 RepID=A0BKX0_PARTE|nr:uncharacterized protein GSPATT00029818001 [Paramecium tetraurelia]CAK59187.1 unnamed protein product [Paramecium tetraurelia]|eukprot:XP_001426585.1 hypothetical protein (macronuclear) [Paramecium tetraurelia strain d4-2]
MSDQEETTPRGAKTHKGKRILESREPKLVEGPKQTLFIRGPKTSLSVRQLAHEWHMIKRDFSTTYNKNHEIQPFEDAKQLETFCERSQCSMFCFVSNSKKRPDNLIIGRTFDKKILDMVELHLKEFKSQEEFATSVEVPMHARPLIVFNGEVFGFNPNHMKLHNLLTDFFFENVPIQDIKSQEIHLIISITASDDSTLAITVLQKQTHEDGIKIQEIGPRSVFDIRRTKWAEDDLFKKACRQPKPKAKPHEKNIVYDEVGDKRGKVFVQQQDLSTLALKKRKKLRKGDQKLKARIESQEQQAEVNEE